MKGTAYGVGVGPGDPEYMTLKAIRLIKENDVIAVPLIDAEHKKAAKLVESYLDQGRNVVYITLGDSTIYCTFSYIQHYLEADGYPVELVAGIPSFCAAAARLNTPLTEWDEPLHVLPAVHKLEDDLALGGNYVLMKSASQMSKVKDMLRRSGRKAVMAENCTMENEKLYRSIDEIPDDAGYFSLIIAKEK